MCTPGATAPETFEFSTAEVRVPEDVVSVASVSESAKPELAGIGCEDYMLPVIRAARGRAGGLSVGHVGGHYLGAHPFCLHRAARGFHHCKEIHRARSFLSAPLPQR